MAKKLIKKVHTFLGMVSFINRDSKKVIELSLTYDGKPAHQWVAAKLFQASMRLVTGVSLDTSNPFDAKIEDAVWTATSKLDVGNYIYITTTTPADDTEPTNKDTGERLTTRDGILIDKKTFNLNNLDEIKIVADPQKG